MTFALLTLLLSPLLGQPGQTGAPIAAGMVVSTGYMEDDSIPHANFLAPGQVITLFVQGAGEGIKEIVKAPDGPLPLVLAGISVDLVRVTPTPVPIFFLRPFVWCTEGAPLCERVLAITIQVPYEINTNPMDIISTYLLIKENGAPKAVLSRAVWRQSVRLMTGIDLIAMTIYKDLFSPLLLKVRHLNGDYVTYDKPASPGEVLKVYATGLGIGTRLGAEDSPPVTGVPAKSPRRFVTGLNYQFGVDPKPTPVNWAQGDPAPEGLVNISLVGGKIGIHELWFRVPEQLPKGTPRCGDPVVSEIVPGGITINVSWNMAISAGSAFRSIPNTVYQYDSAEFCVDVPSPDNP